LLTLVDASCKKGAWNGSEISQVSKIREELVLRLKPLMPEEENEEEQKNVE
jgi:hypothetical protein